MCSPSDVIQDVPEPTPLVAVDGTDVDDDGPSADAPKGAASLVLAKVQSFYDASKDLQSDFKQTYIHPVYGTKTVTQGKLKVKKPGLMVWDYAEADNADIYVDDKNVWVVERDTKQVLTKDIGSSDIAGAEKFLFGGRQLIDDFRVKIAVEKLDDRYGMKGHTSIQLEPKRKNPHYRQLLLVVDDPTGRVDAFVVLNTDNSTNHFVLSGLSTNTGLSKGSMTFKKPKGYTVIKG
jgi:outer membrane lipoprotein carrier protein